MVLYLKYRPQTLEDLVGQVSLKKTLQSAITAGKIAHAYLFCGPRGAGKTSTARILAKIINCEKQDSKHLSPIPCNLCQTCLSITNGTNLDVIEMDAASNRGIEDVRALRENIKLTPTSSRKKVYIIDEAHMLTGEAFNALLKTLEEPPAHVLFILATTEVQKIPITILSRVQRLDFKSATIQEIVESLNKIVSKEGINTNSEALELIAQKSGGSFRDAIKILDQLSSLPSINSQAIEEALGSGTFESIIDLLTAIADGDSTLVLKVINKQIEEGANPKELISGVLDILRQMLFIKEGAGEVLIKAEEDDKRYKLLLSTVNKFSLSKLIYTINFFTASLEQLRFSSIPSLPIEIAAVKSTLLERENNKEQPIQGKIKQEEVSKDINVEIKEAEGKEVSTLEKKGSLDSIEDIKKIEEKWEYLLETVRQFNFSLEALLKTAKVGECSLNSVCLEVPYSFHQRIIEAPKSKDILESILSDILGRHVEVIVSLTKRATTKSELANVEVAADDEIIRLASEIFNSDIN